MGVIAEYHKHDDLTTELFFSAMLGSKIKLLAGLISPEAFLFGLQKAASGQAPIAVSPCAGISSDSLSPARTSVTLNEDSTPITFMAPFNLHSFLEALLLNTVPWQGTGSD